MITMIGIIAGKILELLERRNGILVFGEIHSDLGQPRDKVLMSLGWLLQEKYIQMMEDPSISVYQDVTKHQDLNCTVGAFDLIIGNNAVSSNCKRIKNISEHIKYVADRIMVLMDGCGGLLDLQAIDRFLHNAHRVDLLAKESLRKTRGGLTEKAPSGK